MAEPILFRFQADGAGEVVSAVKSIQQATLEAARAQETLGRSATGAGREVSRASGSGKMGLTYQQKLALQVAADQEKAAKRAAAAQERAAAQAAAAAKKAGLESEKAWNKSVAAAEKAAERAFQATKRAEEKRWREVERTAEKIRKEMDREAAHSEKVADRRARAEHRADQRANSRFTSRGFSMVGGALSSLAGSALGVTEDVIGGAVRGSMETQAIANRVSINARMPGQTAVDPTTLRKEFENTAIATPGVKAQDIARAAQAYVDLTGDLDTARGSMKTFATVASATGASVEDVATAAASFGKHFGIKTQDDMKKVFSILTAQGKGGAMTMHDMASQMQRLAAAGKAFGIGEGVEGVTKLGGLLQVARSATGTPRMAATAVENMLRQLDAKSGKLGIKQYDKSGKKMDLYDNLAQVIAKEGGNDIGAKHAGVNKFFGAQGGRGANPLVTAYEDAARGKHGAEAQKAGAEAVKKALEDAAKTATEWAEVEKDATQAQQDASAKLQGAWSALEAAAGEKLAPKLAELAGRLASDGKVIDLFVAAIGAAATALEALATFLQEKGLISGGSAEDRQTAEGKKAAAAQAKADAIGGKNGERVASLSPEDKARYEGFKKEAAVAGEHSNGAGREALLESWAMSAMSRSSNKKDADKLFEGEYARLGGHKGGATDSVVKGARGLYSTLLYNVTGNEDFAKGAAGENAEQRKLRHAHDEWKPPAAPGASSPGGDTGQGTPMSTEKTQAQLNKLGASVEGLAKKLDAVKVPTGTHSIAPGADH